MIPSIFFSFKGRANLPICLATFLACFSFLIPADTEAASETSLLTGFDSFIDRYTVLEDDTTEALHEYYIGLLNRFSFKGDGIMPELYNSFRFGNQTIDEKLNLNVKLGDPRYLRTEVAGFAYIKHFRETGDYAFSNDYRQFNGNLRLSREVSRNLRIDSKTRAEFVDYDEHSEFDYDYNYIDTGFDILAGNILDNMVRISASLGSSEASDTTELDYKRGLAEVSAYISSGEGIYWETSISTERRKYSGDERSSSWMAIYYSRIRSRSSYKLEYSLNIDGEYLSYDSQSETFFNTHFVRGGVGVGIDLGTGGRFSFQPRYARLICEDFEEERYREFSFQAAYELITAKGLWLSLSYEPGTRDYLEEGSRIYSDFYINRISLMGSVQFGDGIIANLFLIHDPETHTRREDDFSITLISLSLTKKF